MRTSWGLTLSQAFSPATGPKYVALELLLCGAGHYRENRKESRHGQHRVVSDGPAGS